MRYSELDQLQQSLGYQFNDPALLAQALTHRSAGKNNNERLEFLGDAILGLVMAELLYKKFSRASEGQMSRMRSYLVKGRTLAKVALQFKLGDYLQLGPGEMKSGGYRRESILADTVEAILGAIYLESGKAVCAERIAHWFDDLIAHVNPETIDKDPKTRLQEWLQGRKLALPSYEVVRTKGDAHKQTFWVACHVTNAEQQRLSTVAQSRSRQQVEKAAAEMMLTRLIEGH
ncbi:MAG: ribonuclease III [Gammaproteobacteria bacterium]